MVRGLDIFRDFFADYRDCYVLIGGSACDVYFTDQEIPFRVTHDLDVSALGVPLNAVDIKQWLAECLGLSM